MHTWAPLGEPHGQGGGTTAQGPASGHGAEQEPLAASAGSALSPKHSPGWPSLTPLKHPSCARCKATDAEVIDLNDIPKLSLTVLR